MSDVKKVKILKDGPYEIEGDIPLKISYLEDDGEGATESFSFGKEYEKKEIYCLCRCGRSKDKPYCDGTHEKINFDGTETADNIPYLKSTKLYEGKRFCLRDKKELCAVARFCDRFENTWYMTIRSSKDDVDKEKMAIYMAESCPSGRLTVEKDGKLFEPEYEKEVNLINDKRNDCKGPLFIKGGIQIEGASGTIYEIRNRVTLCRCGESGNMPFCDASHLNAEHMKGLDK